MDRQQVNGSESKFRNKTRCVALSYLKKFAQQLGEMCAHLSRRVPPGSTWLHLAPAAHLCSSFRTRTYDAEKLLRTASSFKVSHRLHLGCTFLSRQLSRNTGCSNRIVRLAHLNAFESFGFVSGYLLLKQPTIGRQLVLIIAVKNWTQ